jgi:5-hydroxyisourate hydrolase
MSTISTHVLDTSLGKPAEGIRVTLYRDTSLIGSSVTDADGRARGFLADGSSLSAGDYRLTFSVADYFGATKRKSFYNEIVIHFAIAAEDEHYHVPLLVSPFGYSTYRGS